VPRVFPVGWFFPFSHVICAHFPRTHRRRRRRRGGERVQKYKIISIPLTTDVRGRVHVQPTADLSQKYSDNKVIHCNSM